MLILLPSWIGHAGWSTNNCRLIGLVLAVAMTTASWLLILMLVHHAFGISVSARFLISVGTTISGLSAVTLAVLVGASR